MQGAALAVLSGSERKEEDNSVKAAEGLQPEN